MNLTTNEHEFHKLYFRRIWSHLCLSDFYKKTLFSNVKIDKGQIPLLLIPLKHTHMHKLNPFVHSFRRKGIVALFNSITLSTVYLTEKKFETILKKPTKELLEENFFVDGNFEALDYLRDYKQKLNKKQHLGIAYFLVTSSCNYKCEYCFVESRFDNPQNTKMTKEVAKKGIELIKRNTNRIKIIFYGGEPFLNFEIIKYVADEANKNNLEVNYTIISNGSIVNEEIIKFLKDYNVSLSISLDGQEETNDKARKYHNNKGTFQKVKKTLHQLKDAGIRFGISCTISTYNMNKPEEILEILEEFNIKGFGYNLLSENNNIRINEEENITMVRNLLAAEDLIFEKKLIEDRVINRKLKPFVEKRNWLRDCAGYGQQIIITPNGEVGTCHGLWPDLVNDESRTYFDVDVNYKEKIIEHPTWKEWFSRIPFNMPQCWGCYGLGLCGGGCAKNSLLRTGSIWDVDEDICILTKQSVPWVIWKYYDEKIRIKETVPNNQRSDGRDDQI